MWNFNRDEKPVYWLVTGFTGAIIGNRFNRNTQLFPIF
jgi:hypothetical protein